MHSVASEEIEYRAGLNADDAMSPLQAGEAGPIGQDLVRHRQQKCAMWLDEGRHDYW